MQAQAKVKIKIVPPVFMSLAQPGCNIYYANLFIFLSGIICVFGAATYFIIVFGAAMTLPLLVLGLSAPTVFLCSAQNYILGHGAICIFDLGARQYYCRGRTIVFLTTA